MPTPMPDATKNPGIYQTITDTNSSDAIEVPDGAVGVWLWFVDGDGTLIEGQFGTSDSNTSITGLDGTTDDLGLHPAMPTYHRLPNRSYVRGGSRGVRPLYLHVACTTPSAVVKGCFFF